MALGVENQPQSPCRTHDLLSIYLDDQQKIWMHAIISIRIAHDDIDAQSAQDVCRRATCFGTRPQTSFVVLCFIYCEKKKNFDICAALNLLKLIAVEA